MSRNTCPEIHVQKYMSRNTFFQSIFRSKNISFIISNTMYGLIYNLIRSGKSGQTGGANVSDTANIVTLMVALLIYLALILVLGKYIWNNVLVKAVNGVNRLSSV